MDPQAAITLIVVLMGRKCAGSFAGTDPDPIMSDTMNILHHSADGYVATCCSCGRLQLAFGTTLAHLEPCSMRWLLTELERDEEAHAGKVDPRMKVFVHHIGRDDVRLVLNMDELQRLRAMIADALWFHGVYSTVNEVQG